MFCKLLSKFLSIKCSLIIHLVHALTWSYLTKLGCHAPPNKISLRSQWTSWWLSPKIRPSSCQGLNVAWSLHLVFSRCNPCPCQIPRPWLPVRPITHPSQVLTQSRCYPKATGISSHWTIIPGRPRASYACKGSTSLT